MILKTLARGSLEKSTCVYGLLPFLKKYSLYIMFVILCMIFYAAYSDRISTNNLNNNNRTVSCITPVFFFELALKRKELLKELRLYIKNCAMENFPTT